MHVIAKPALVAFWTKHPDAENPLNTWYRAMQKEAFTDFNHLRATYPSADQVGKFTVFNISGNKYRLIAEIYYDQRVVLIRNVLTHAAMIAATGSEETHDECSKNTRATGHLPGVGRAAGGGWGDFGSKWARL